MTDAVCKAIMYRETKPYVDAPNQFGLGYESGALAGDDQHASSDSKDTAQPMTVGTLANADAARAKSLTTLFMCSNAHQFL